MHFPGVAEALRYVCSEEDGSLLTQHTQIACAATANTTQENGYAFMVTEPLSLVLATDVRSQKALFHIKMHDPNATTAWETPH